eukprot:gene8404-9885_t
MVEYIANGLNTFDLADHYGPAEELYGEVITQVRNGQVKLDVNNIHAFTKWFPKPGNVTLEMAASAVKRSMTRMKVDKLDLLQFHWWDYDDNRYIDACAALKTLQSQGLIRHIGLTNFDTIHMRRVIDSGVKIVTNQVSYSIIDRRAEKHMATFCQEKDVHIIAYGVVLGGLISEKDFVNRWGGWNKFQDLLEVLKRVGNRHGVSLTMVAIRFVLERPRVCGAIIGCRWGITKHIDELTKQLFSFKLSLEDIKQIDLAASKGDTMLGWSDCGDESTISPKMEFVNVLVRLWPSSASHLAQLR